MKRGKKKGRKGKKEIKSHLARNRRQKNLSEAVRVFRKEGWIIFTMIYKLELLKVRVCLTVAKAYIVMKNKVFQGGRNG